MGLVPNRFGLYKDGVPRFEPMDYRMSLSGRYFLGQTPEMSVTSDNNSWGELYNPENSGLRLYVNVWTVTNVSGNNFTGGIFFDSVMDEVLDSGFITCTNMCPDLPENVGVIRYRDNESGLVPVGGIEAFTRRIPQQTTVISVENGKYIIPPGKRIGILARSATGNAVSRIAFGWWEVPNGEEGF